MKVSTRFNPVGDYCINTFLPLLVIMLVCTSCLNKSASRSETEPQDVPAPLTPVPPDGTLETVTWNIEWYGSDSNGPTDEDQQTNRVVEVLDSLRADLYAFQEIYSQEALERITSRLSGYQGFVADFIDQPQKTAFIYNTAVIDSVSSGAITEEQNENDWAGGRFPMYFQFNYSFQDTEIPVYAVVIHAKAFDDRDAYERRRRAAQSLHAYLTAEKPDAHIVILGDYNDDVDESIYNGEQTPYGVFEEDNRNFRIPTLALSERKLTSTVGFEDMVDHVTMSDELFDIYIPSSEDVFSELENLIPDYGTTTSDHFPVWVKFDVRKN